MRKRIEKGMTVNIVNQDVRNYITFGSLFSGEGKPSLMGEVLLVAPNVDDIIPLHETFKLTLKDLGDDDLVYGLVYFDTGTNRPYLIGKYDVEVVENV